MYAYPTSAHRSFRSMYRPYKGNIFVLDSSSFIKQNMVLQSALTLLNTNTYIKSKQTARLPLFSMYFYFSCFDFGTYRFL